MSIERLNYVTEFVDEPTRQILLAASDRQPWLDNLQRRVQHYGYKYDYKAHKLVTML